MDWSGCGRGDERDRPVLHVRSGWLGNASLLLWDAAGKPHWIRLELRLARLLLVLSNAWQEDGDTQEQFRGFRSPDQISASMKEFPEAASSLSSEAIRRYVYLVRLSIRKSDMEEAHAARYAANRGGLIETERRVGYRIGACGMDVVVVDPNGRPTAHAA